MTSRTETLRKAVVDSAPEICVERALAITESCRETEGKPLIIRRALAFRNILEKMSIRISPGELIVGNQAGKIKAAPIFPEYGVRWLSEEIDSLPERKLDPFLVSGEVREQIGPVIDYWNGKTHQDLVLEKTRYGIPEAVREAYNLNTCSLNQAISNASHTSTGDGHVVVNYEKVLGQGLLSIIMECRREAAKLSSRGMRELGKKLFLEAAVISCEAVIFFAHRFADKALELAGSSSGKRKKELLEIARICRKVPACPADTFHEALQSYWFIHLALQIESNGHSISFGRFDQILNPYYTRDAQSGKLTREEALELIELFFIKSCELNKIREWVFTEFMSGYPMFQTLTLGGQTERGEDAVNEVSFLALEATRNLKLEQPTTVIRYYNGSSEEFLLEAAKTLLEHQGGMPGFFSDEVAIPLLLNLKQGITLEEARNWAVVGCSEPVIPGKFNSITGGVCHVNLLKILELTLNNGRNPVNGITLYPGRGRLADFGNFRELTDAFQEQIAFYLGFIPFLDSVTSSAYRELTPTPFMSSLVDHRVEAGMDVSEGFGDKNYNVMLTHVHGSANIGNSLAAIRKLVFDEKKIDPKDLENALASNFENNERMRQLLMTGAPKYGNDEPYVDMLVKETLDFVAAEMQKHPGPRGGCYGISTQGLTANVPIGKAVEATPDGRKAKEPVADNNSPSPGTDRNGPTAAIKSVSRIDHTLISQGTIFNMKFHPITIQGSDRMRKFVSLLRTYFEMKGFQVQFNVISPEILQRAQAEPERYRDLIVKVAGYSARFSTLDKELQDQIILRTMHELG